MPSRRAEAKFIQCGHVVAVLSAQQGIGLRQGISHMHCRSDAYLAEEICLEMGMEMPARA